MRASPNKELVNIDISKILDTFIDGNDICRVCGLSHSYNPKYEDIRSSIDIIPELFRLRKYSDL